MSRQVSAQVKQLERQEDVREALSQTGQQPAPEKPKAATRDKVWFGSYVLLLVGLGVLYYLFSLRFFGLPRGVVDYLLRYTRGVMLIVLVLTLAKAVEIYLIGRVRDTVNRFDLRRILRLLTGLVVLFIVISMVFINWYTAVVSLGVVSLIFGFAMQTVLASFIGWIYILVRRPYRVGDRVRIGDATGDVIDVSYLDTTLWEFGGQYLSTDHPSGRIIKFPNSNALSETVYNYSWPLFPYIWNEIKFQIAYGSDLEFVGTVMQETAEAELGEAMMRRVGVYRELLEQTPVDELQVKEHPSVVFRIGDNTWVEAIVRYLVVPKEQGRVKTRLIKKMLARLNAEPDRVMFPKGDMR